MEGKSRLEKKKLSKSILEMKFMKKTKEKVYQDIEDEEGRAMFASEVTEAMRLGGSRFIIEPSFVPCEELIIGRLSYHGMNPELERLLELEKNPEKVNVKDEKDISDADMAKHYSSVVSTVANKFQKNKNGEPPRKKTKFLKPEDD